MKDATLYEDTVCPISTVKLSIVAKALYVARQMQQIDQASLLWCCLLVWHFSLDEQPVAASHIG